MDAISRYLKNIMKKLDDENSKTMNTEIRDTISEVKNNNKSISFEEILLACHKKIDSDDNESISVKEIKHVFKLIDDNGKVNLCKTKAYIVKDSKEE